MLVLDPAGRVLLLHGFDPARPEQPYWLTIGGGLAPDEGTAQAAIRELREEAGIEASVADLVGPVWQRQVEFSFNGTRYRQDEDYYVLRVGQVEVSFSGMEEIERQTTLGHRWWSADELAGTDEPFGPRELPALLRQLPDPAQDST